jgi:cell division protein FtsI (penicillin-binding protein 3)
VTGPSRRRRIAAPRLRTRTAGQLGVRRIRWLLVIYALLMVITVGKLVEIQVINADTYADLGVQQRARTIDLPATRGRVYDRDGDVLATSVQAATIYGDPRRFRGTTTPDGHAVPPAADAAEVGEQLAPLLGLEAAEITERLQEDAHFVYLGRQLDHEVGVAVRELNLPGVGVLQEPERIYPSKGLAAQVVGFTGIDGEGLQGLEARYDTVLSGQPGMLVLERAPGGLDIASGVRELVPPEVGTDLVLTIDRDIQHVAERAALEAMEEHNAVGASVLVMEAATQEVLAMASVPGFDPNTRGEEDRSTWRNRAVTDVFEPGSTQKALTVAAAIEEGLVTADTTMSVDDGILVHGKRFTDSSRHETEEWSVSDIMERSSNVGTIQIAQELGPERLEDYLRDFGYGTPTGGAFPGESGGLLMSHEDWWGTSLPTIAIGQGVAVTLLQAASSYATIANDGVAVTPRIVRGSVGEDGRLTPSVAPRQHRVISAETSEQVRGMLEKAVAGEAGTGALAMVDGYRVAGKTGTARKPAEGARGYSGEYVATFVGFAPVDDPQIVVAVMLDEPRPQYYGGLVSAPVFSEVMEAALDARRVAPDGAGPGLGEAMDAARLQAEQRAAEQAEQEALSREADEADETDQADEADEAGDVDEPEGAVSTSVGSAAGGDDSGVTSGEP